MTALLSIERNLAPHDGGTTLRFPFEVPLGTRTLCIRMSYAPMRLEDPERARELIQVAMRTYVPWEAPENWERYSPLTNLITLSLDDPAGYRGNAHRKDGRQVHTLSESEASRGFLPGAILPGEWRASVHIHALVTEGCGLRLSIEEVGA